MRPPQLVSVRGLPLARGESRPALSGSVGSQFALLAVARAIEVVLSRSSTQLRRRSMVWPPMCQRLRLLFSPLLLSLLLCGRPMSTSLVGCPPASALRWLPRRVGIRPAPSLSTCGSRRVVLSWIIPHTFDPVPYLHDPVVRAAYFDPEVMRKPEEEWPTGYPPCARSHG